MIVAIEGGDQAGKKTQSAMLVRAMKKRGVRAAQFSFPDYSTPIGRQIRACLQGRRKTAPEAIHCLMAANRWERAEDIRRAARSSRLLVMNRYYHSNLVYGVANGLRPSWLEGLDAGLPRAGLVILLDVTQKESFRRKRRGRDRFESSQEFSCKVARAYRRVAKRRRWKVIDAGQDRAAVHAQVIRAVEARLRA